MESAKHVNHYTVWNIDPIESDKTLIRFGNKQWRNLILYGACICNPIGGVLELGYNVELHIQDSNSCDCL